jgi:hypothetical protein
MPVHTGTDAKGRWYQWGSQKKYYGQGAKAKAEAQGRAAHAAGYKSKIGKQH